MTEAASAALGSWMVAVAGGGDGCSEGSETGAGDGLGSIASTGWLAAWGLGFWADGTDGLRTGSDPAAAFSGIMDGDAGVWRPDCGVQAIRMAAASSAAEAENA
jgi:hypothetical protein